MWGVWFGPCNRAEGLRPCGEATGGRYLDPCRRSLRGDGGFGYAPVPTELLCASAVLREAADGSNGGAGIRACAGASCNAGPGTASRADGDIGKGPAEQPSSFSADVLARAYSAEPPAHTGRES